MITEVKDDGERPGVGKVGERSCDVGNFGERAFVLQVDGEGSNPCVAPFGFADSTMADVDADIGQ